MDDSSKPSSVPRISILTPNITQMSSEMMELPMIPTISIASGETLRKSFPLSTSQIPPSSSSDLVQRLVGDVCIGTGVTFTIVPFLTVVDKAIVQSAAGTHTMLASAVESMQSMVRQPGAYLRSPLFLLMWATYAATYSTANSLKTITEHYDKQRMRDTNKSEELPSKTFNVDKNNSNNSNNSKFTVFVGTSLVNCGASLMKDRAYARMFGTSGAATRSVPMVTMGLWATRDFLVVGSSFVLPDIMSQHLQAEYNLPKAQAQSIAQLTLPVATQFLAGPIQLLGLDFYNRPLANHSWTSAFVDRARFLAQGFTSVVSARILRIAPGYGVGGVLNTRFRDAWRERVQDSSLSLSSSSTMSVPILAATSSSTATTSTMLNRE